MNPIMGPFVTETGADAYGTGAKYRYKSGYRQTKPFDLPTEYVCFGSDTISYSSTNLVPEPNAFSRPNYRSGYNNVWVNLCGTAFANISSVGTAQSQAKNNAYAKFVAKLPERIEALVSLAERRQALGMVEGRLRDLLRFCSAFRSKSPAAMRALSKNFKMRKGDRSTLRHYLSNWRSVANDLGSAWLEFHFGWAPIVRDIDVSLQLLSSPIANPGHITVHSKRCPWSYSKTVNGTYPTTKTVGQSSGYSTAHISCEVSIHNEQRAYNSVLGLNNPVLVAYSLIPYSWMLDWVHDLGLYIASWNDLAGFTVSKSSYYVVSQGSGSAYFEYPKGTFKYRSVFSGFTGSRKLGLPSVTPTWKPLKPLSWSRGLTLISLLTQRLEEGVRYVRK